MLSDAGYATGMFGKWHLGDAEGRYPTDQGFDEWYGIPNSSDQAFWPDSDSFQADSGVEFTRIMTAVRGEKPEKKEVYGRAKRATIDEKSLITRWTLSSAKPLASSHFLLTFPTLKPMSQWMPILILKVPLVMAALLMYWLRLMPMLVNYYPPSMVSV